MCLKGECSWRVCVSLRGSVVGVFCLKGECSWVVSVSVSRGSVVGGFVSVSRGNVVGFFCVSQGGV